MKKSILRLLPVFAMSFVVACSGRFQSHPPMEGEVPMTSVDDDGEPVIHTEFQGQHGTYQIVRYSKAITLKNVTAKKDKDQFTVNADLSFRGKEEGPIEMVAQSTDSNGDTVLVPKDVTLQDKFKAKVTCTSDDGSCDNYFIDFFAKEGQTFYVDQYVQDTPMAVSQTGTGSSADSVQAPKLEKISVQPLQISPPAAPATTLQKIPVTKPVVTPATVLPPKQTTTTTSTTTSTAKKKSQPVPSPTLPKIPVIKALPTTTTSTTTSTSTTVTGKSVAETDEDDEEDIPEANPGRYVGTSDREIVSIFESPAIVVQPGKPEVTPVPTPTVPTPTVPKKNPAPAPKAPVPSQPQQEDMGTPDVTQAINQAIGLPSRGRLQNATNLLELIQDENYPLTIMWPAKKRYFSTQAMASFLKKLGSFAQTMIPGYKLTLSDVSIQRGGPILTNGRMGHKGHQNGNDADISYIVKDNTAVLTKLVTGQKLSRELMLKEQWALVKEAYKTGQVAVIFMDPVIKHSLCYEAQQEGDLKNSADRGEGYEALRRIYPLGGHANHFHVRIKCGAGDATCRDQNWKYSDSGCFTGSLQKKVKDEDDN